MTYFPRQMMPLVLYHDQIDYALRDGIWGNEREYIKQGTLKLSLYKDIF